MHFGVRYFLRPCLSVYICACSPGHSPSLCISTNPVQQCCAASMTRLCCQTAHWRGQKVKVCRWDSNAPKFCWVCFHPAVNFDLGHRLFLCQPSGWACHCSNPSCEGVYRKDGRNTLVPALVWHMGLFSCQSKKKRSICAPFWLQKLLNRFLFERHDLWSRNSSVYWAPSNFPAGWWKSLIKLNQSQSGHI